MPTSFQKLMILSLLVLAGCAESEDDAFVSEKALESNAEARPETLGGTPEVRKKRAPLEWAKSKKYQSSGPFKVFMAELPVNVYDPKNKLARGWGQDGKAKRMTKRIPPEEAQRLRDEAMKMTPSPKLQAAQSSVLSGKSPAAGIGFDSLDITDCCGGGANVPPDPELAVGPNHIIAVVNVALEIYDKTGSLLAGPITFSSFFGTSTDCDGVAVFDPNVLYDEEAGRWILGGDCDGTHYSVAASATSDPLGDWNIYSFATDFAGAFFDYPHAGVGVDAIFMGSNQFGGTLSGGFEGRVFAMDKAALYSGSSPMAVVSHSTGFDGGTPQPMNLHGFNVGTWPDSGPHYIMTEVFDGITHTVWSWADPFGTDTFTNEGDLNLNTATGVTAGFPVDVPQSGGSNIQGNDWRGLDTEYRNGYIWMTNTIACNPGSGTVNCLRWAKIDPSVPSVMDSGVYASNGEYRIFPDLAVNQCGDMAIGYTKSSSSIFPGIWVTGRENTDAAGTLQAETQLKSGEIAYSAFDSVPRRWGDYTGMTIDPNGKTFWYLGEYSKDTENASGRWGTYIGSYSFPSCIGDDDDDFLLSLIPAIAAAANGLHQQVVNPEWQVANFVCCTTSKAKFSLIQAGTTRSSTAQSCESPGTASKVATSTPGTKAFSAKWNASGCSTTLNDAFNFPLSEGTRYLFELVWENSDFAIYVSAQSIANNNEQLETLDSAALGEMKFEKSFKLSRSNENTGEGVVQSVGKLDLK